MLTGSTSALITLFPRPSCWLLRNRAFVAKRHSTTLLPRSTLPLDGLRNHSTPANGIPHLDENGVDHLVRSGLLSASSLRGPRSAPGPNKRKCPSQRRRTLLWVMLTTKSPDRAWAAYQELLSYGGMIPPHLLHQLARLLASVQPRTRTVHLQLLSVLKTLPRHHGRLRLWEWNTLIDSVGKQWHKTRLEDYENALDIFDKKGTLPVANAVSPSELVDTAADSYPTPQDPDIWTYNILLSIASRSNSPFAVRHASSLLLASGLAPNRYTHLCLLGYYTLQKDLRSIRSTLQKMEQQGLEVGLDGVNACLWAYARSGRLDVALPLYRILRSNVDPMPDSSQHHNDHHHENDVGEDARYVRDTIGLDIPDGLVPDAITYTTMIQSLAFHGDLKNALGVYVDMLSTPVRDADGVLSPAFHRPSMAAFRGLFLGFARHGRDDDSEPRTGEAESIAALFPSSQANWNLDALESVFAAFLQLPGQPKPTASVVYWILVAFDKTSGSDAVKLREVWAKLEGKYGSGWGGRLEEIRRSIFVSETPDPVNDVEDD